MTVFDGELDVLRVMIEPADDDEILDASGDIEATSIEESQIAGTQKSPRIRIGKSVVMLNHDARLYPHHLDDSAPFRFDQPMAEVSQHPSDPSRWGLKNLGAEGWTATSADGTVRGVEPGRNVLLAVGTRIHFGKAEGEITR